MIADSCARSARRTWRYFDDFVGPQTSWLPPDNVQETPTREIFMRTSPTNIGLWMLATVAANDFGYITIDDLVERNLRTLETLGRLERFEGHLFNWYDLSTLEPLRPRYVSAVDSGNLLASLWTFETSCDELAARPLLDESALRGIADTLGVLRQIAPSHERSGTPFGVSSLGGPYQGPAGEFGGNHSTNQGSSRTRAGSSAPLPRPGNRSAHLLGATDFEAGRGVERRHR